MREIKLSHKKIIATAIIDDDDFDRVSKWKWKLNDNGYAVRNHWNGKKGKYDKMYMHRFILGTKSGLDTDHINRNKLDNRKANLRSTSRSLNNFNSPESRANTSGVKGVSWFKPAKLWRAYITIGRKQIALGYSKSKDVAIQLRKQAEVKYGVAI